MEVRIGKNRLWSCHLFRYWGPTLVAFRGELRLKIYEEHQPLCDFADLSPQ